MSAGAADADGTAVAGDLIVTADTVITMDRGTPRAGAVAVSGGRIVAIGSAEECRAALPGAPTVHAGPVLMPGFVESHSHPVLSGTSTMAPSHYIAPWVAPTWDDVLRIFAAAIAESPADQPLSFFGFDGLLQKAEDPTRETLDAIFGDRIVLVMGNSGHTAYVTTAVLEKLDWIESPPADPLAGSYGRHADGSLNGVAFEVPAVMAIAGPVLGALSEHPLQGPVEYYALLSRAGITSASELTFTADLQKPYEALAALPGSPLRITMYHMSTEAGCGEPFVTAVPATVLRKQGIKLWADGSPWVGNIAMSTPYLDTPTVRAAGINPAVHGTSQMNYTRDQLDEVLAAHAREGWQFAFHVNGDLALDTVLDAYELALNRFGLLGTDHRWRVEHVGGARQDQFARMARLGVVASMGPFQFYYWGDLLDGQMFDSVIGAEWQRFRDAFDAQVHPSFHNDGSVSPPTPLLNVQTAVTRRTSSGTQHGPAQASTLTEALEAITINAAYALHFDQQVGSLAVGKLADFTVLGADPYEVEPEVLGAIPVLGTWLGGVPVDLPAFGAAAGLTDPAEFERLSTLPRPPAC